MASDEWRVASNRLTTILAGIGIMAHVAVVAVLQAQGGGSMPRSVTIPYRVSCPTCRIDITQVTTLAPNGLDAPSGSLARDSRGRYFVIEQQRKTILVYDGRGVFLRSLGRAGNGPGEFGPAGLSKLRVGRGDSLYVVESMRRLSAFDSSLRFVRQVRLPASPNGGIALADGRFILNYLIHTPDRAGYPFHLVDAAGSITRSFGPKATERTPPPILLTLAMDGRTMWALKVHPPVYRVSAWTIESGEPAWAVEVTDIPWLPKDAPPQRAPAPVNTGRRSVAELHRTMDSFFKNTRTSSAARAGLAGIDEAGRLWVNWSIPIAGNPAKYRYVVDVVDLNTRAVLASRDVVAPLTLIGGGFAYRTIADADDIRSVVVYRVDLRRP